MRLALLLFASLLFFGTNAQVTLTLDPLISQGFGDLNDATTNRKDVKAAASVKNTSAETKTFIWTLTVESKEQPWAVVVCDINSCYDSTVVTEQFNLMAGQTGTMDVHVYPSGNLITLDGAVPGTGVAKVQIRELGNGDNQITGEYQFEIIGDAISSLSEFQIAQLELFPNPTTDYFELKGPIGVKDITIYNLLGTPVERFQYQEGSKYDMSSFPKGIYLVTLTDEKHQLLKTVRLQKS